MPVRKVSGGWQWGTTGKVYARKADAERQAAAAYASGYKSKKRKQNGSSTTSRGNDSNRGR